MLQQGKIRLEAPFQSFDSSQRGYHM